MNQYPALPLNRLASQEIIEAVAVIDRLGVPALDAVAQLATAALHNAETEPQMAYQWLAIARALNPADAQEQQAQIAYAQARLDMQAGDLVAAEKSLSHAQNLWKTSGNQAALTRSHLGLTQVLTLLGRFDDAEDSIRQAIQNLEEGALSNPAMHLQLAGAYQNLANLLTRQDKHQLALREFSLVQDNLDQYRQRTDILDLETLSHVEYMIASMLLNEAIALMFLDQPTEAEQKLHKAIKFFDQTDDWLNRGRAHSNLGSLYLRSGHYAMALQEFDKALVDLTAETISDDPNRDGKDTFERWRQADVTPLDQAMAYLALNLLPEATTTLERCEQFFRNSDRPYELGQCLYTLGLVRMSSKNMNGAKLALDEAEWHFHHLDSVYWLNRTRLALSTLAYHSQERDVARTLTDTLIQDLTPINVHENRGMNEETVVQWDTGSLTELQLQRLRLHLDEGEFAEAATLAGEIETILGAPSSVSIDNPSMMLSTLPHLHLRLQHMWGQIEQATGDQRKAQTHFRQAIGLLDSQRASLPIEEIRTAFLDDKTRIYDDLVLSLLEGMEGDQNAMSQAIDVIEQARSRSLLERLYATMTGEHESTSKNSDLLEQRRTVRQRLHWHYNRLLSREGDSRGNAEINQAIQADEAMLQQMEWKMSSLLEQAQPVDLARFQQTLDHDKQALVYYIAGDEVLVFLVNFDKVEIFRNLCTISELKDLQSELRFQLGRAELGSDYLNRHGKRLQRALQQALRDLYQSLIAPLETKLTATRLQIIPYGSLHQLPFHALWDGTHYLIERFECTYVPSASIATHCHTNPRQLHNRLTLAGFAITDPTIPQARVEVETIAHHFEQHALYLDDRANESGMTEAVAQADILHVATHGLFRADNPFFSALKLADGWLDVRDIYRLPLQSYLVVLSACESGASRVRGGDELIGLARGFLGAGAHQLLVTLWNVNDISAAQLMDRFYTHLVNADAPQQTATALRLAQLEAIEAGQHPYFWAPFFMIG